MFVGVNERECERGKTSGIWSSKVSLWKKPWCENIVNCNSHSLFIEPYHLNCELSLLLLLLFVFCVFTIVVAIIFYFCQRTHLNSFEFILLLYHEPYDVYIKLN